MVCIDILVHFLKCPLCLEIVFKRHEQGYFLLADSTDQFKVLLSSTDANFTDCSVQLSIPDDEEFDFQDALTMEAIKLITKCQESKAYEGTISENLPDSTSSNNIPNATYTSVSETSEPNMPVENVAQTQNVSNCGTCGSKVSTPAINATKATITSREDGKSVINIPLVVKKEDLTLGTSVELPVKVGDDQKPKCVVQINLPRCLDCKNEPACECCKTKQCGNNNFNVTVQNDRNNTVMNPMYDNTSVPTCGINEVPMILDPSLEKEINSLM